MYNTVNELYNRRFKNDVIIFINHGKKVKLDKKFRLINLRVKDYYYHGCFTEELDDQEKLDYEEEINNMSSMSLLEGTKEVPKGL